MATSPAPRKVDWIATGALVGATLCWGLPPVMLKFLAGPGRVADGFCTNLVRYPVAMLFYLPVLIWAARAGKLRHLWLPALIPTAVNLLGQTLWATAPYYLDASVIAFLLRLAAIFGIAGAFLVFPDERRLARSWVFWTGVALAAVGFLTMSWIHVSAVAGASWTGIVIMFFTSMGYGLYGVGVRYVMRDTNPILVFAVIGTYTSIGLIIVSPLGELSSLLHLDALSWLILILSAICGITLAHSMYYTAVQRLGVAVSTMMLSVTPFVSLGFAALFLGERLTVSQLIGGCLLIVGASVAMRAEQHLKRMGPPTAHELANE